MEHYTEMLKKATNGGAGEVKMWKSIELVDELLNNLKMHHPDAYNDFMHSQHTVLYGSHYNEELALADVAKMHHTNKQTGGKVSGEHFSMEKAKSVYIANKSKMHPADTAFDVYVAINANWHDKANLYASWFDNEEVDSSIIEDAIAFYFFDEDAPDGKVYVYMSAMRK